MFPVTTEAKKLLESKEKKTDHKLQQKPKRANGGKEQRRRSSQLSAFRL